MPIGPLRARARFAGSLLAVFFAVAAAGGCDCGTGHVTQSGGRLVFDVDQVDFGYVIVGQEKEVKVKVTNEGRGALNVRSIDRDAGFPPDVRYSPGHMTLESGETQELTLLFAPSDVGLQSGKLLFRNDSGDDPVTLAVRGTGIKANLVIDPAAVDFGPVILDDVGEKSATLTNAGDTPLDVTADPLGGDQPDMFHVILPGADQHHLTLDAQQSVVLRLTFQPSTTGQAAATFTVRPCPTCDPTQLGLKGRGVAAGLVTDPETLDFGSVLPQTTATKTLTFHNIGSKAIGLTSIQPAQAGTEFAVVAPDAWPTLQPGDTWSVDVTYSPTNLGADASSLVVKTDDERSPQFEVAVKGYGGGPDMQVLPSALEYGVTAIGFPVTRRLTIQNAGLGDPSSNRGDLTVSAVDLPAGPFSYAIEGGGSVPFTVSPGQRKVLLVTYNPASVEEDTATLTLHSNDVGGHPTFDVPLHGKGKLVPPCTYELSPAPVPGLAYGVVQRGRSEELTFTLHNTGTSACIIGKLDFGGGSSSAFSLPAGPVYGQQLDPGARLVTAVDFDPPGSDPSGTNYSGAIDLQLSSTQAPTQSLQLTGRGAEVCLSITPAGVDFGVVEPNCETNDRKFTIYNACQTAVNVTSIAPGQTASPFRVLTGRQITSANPLHLAPQDEFSFTARYRPAQEGTDSGTIDVFTDQTVTQSPPAPYVLTLTGEGENNARATETFHQASVAKADILFVVDDSGSMDDKQRELAQNFSSFMNFALQQQIDYHIAVTTTGIDDEPPYGGSADCVSYPNANGMFEPLGGADQIVSPALPDPFGTFANNVHVGSYGCNTEQPLEGMYAALSDPNLNGANAGFLRPDAFLSVIIVSDAEDQSARPLTFYENFIENVKGVHGSNSVSVSAIVDTDTGTGPTLPASSLCSQNNIEVDPDFGDTRYVPLVQQTGGVLENICNANWSQTLQQLGVTAFGYKSRFILSSDPDPSTLKVSINGVDVPAGPLWSFSPDTESVDFLPTAIPPPGSEIDISYAVACNR